MMKHEGNKQQVCVLLFSVTTKKFRKRVSIQEACKHLLTHIILYFMITLDLCRVPIHYCITGPRTLKSLFSDWTLPFTTSTSPPFLVGQ